MIIRDVIKKENGVLVEGQCDTKSDFSDFEDFVKDSFSTSPDTLEGSILYVVNEGNFYVKNSNGEWLSGDEESGNSSSANTLSVNNLSDRVSSSILGNDSPSILSTDEISPSVVEEYT